MTIGAFGVYLLEVSIFMSILYLFNKLLLGRDTLHHLNRYLWLLTIVGSFLLPISIEYDDPLTEPILGALTSEVQGVVSQSVDVVESNILSLGQIVKALFIIYICGVALFAVHFFLLYLSLFRLLWRNPYRLNSSDRSEDHALLSRFAEYEAELGIRGKIRYIVHDFDLSPFSWFGYVVVSRSDIEENSQSIILHELSHIKQYHSLDLLVANITTIILWFNPTSWLVKRALQQVHEYCADEAVIQCGVNIKKYQLILIKKSVGSRLQSISNTLNHSNLKNRITMMLKKKSPKMAVAKCLYAIPLLFCVISLLSLPVVAQVTDAVKASDYKVIDNTSSATQEGSGEEEPFLFVDTMPKFNGSGDLSDFRDWCLRTLCYPHEEAENKIEGRVIASFWVMRDGSVANINIIQSPNLAFANEAIRILSSSPKWTPGSQRGEVVPVKFTIPIEFSIN